MKISECIDFCLYYRGIPASAIWQLDQIDYVRNRKNVVNVFLIHSKQHAIFYKISLRKYIDLLAHSSKVKELKTIMCQ